MRVVVDNYIVNKTVYDKLASKISTVDTRRFVLKTQYNTAESGLAKKIVDTNKEYLTLVDLFKKKQILMLRSLWWKVNSLVTY